MVDDQVVLWAVVFVRFGLPLLIPKFPLPAIVACLVMDAVDQTVFQTFTDLDLTGYQGYDKALDTFYLSVAMLTTLRNWDSRPAVQVARFLFYYRLAGSLLFELTAWRPVLLLFPNTFEYFFVAFELLRSRWEPSRRSARFYLWAAAVIWVVVKLPQEYWIHIAQLDATDVIKEHVLGAPNAGWDTALAQAPPALGLLVAVVVTVAVGAAVALRRVLAPAEHPPRLVADPVPTIIDQAYERDVFVAHRWRVLDLRLVEKIVLVACITVIFAEVLPGVDASVTQVVWGVAVIATINAFLRIRVARRGRARESAVMSFLVLAATNTVIVLVADLLLRRGDGALPLAPTLFFLGLLTLIVTLYDRWRPVFDVRFSAPRADGTGR